MSVMQPELSIEPPVDVEDFEEDDEGPPSVTVYCSLYEHDGTCRSAAIRVSADADEVTFAEAWVSALRGASSLRSPRLRAAIERRLSRSEDWQEDQ